MKTYKARWECMCGATGTVSVDAESDMQGHAKAISLAVDEGQAHVDKAGCNDRGVRIFDEETK